MPVTQCPKVPTRHIYSGESTVYAADFNNHPELVAGEALTGTPSVAVSPSGPTLGTPSLGTGANLGKVLFNISTATADTAYTITVTVDTDGSNTIELVCPLHGCG